MFIVTYPEYDASQTPEWIFIKGVVDDYARKGVEEEEARGYLLDEDSDFGVCKFCCLTCSIIKTYTTPAYMH